MALGELELELRQLVRDWADAQTPVVPLRWDNRTTGNPDPNDTEIRWRFRNSDERRLDMGATVRHTGTSTAQLLVPRSRGIHESLTLLHSLSGAVSGVPLLAGAGETLKPASIMRVGRQGAHFRQDLLVRWEYDETRVPRDQIDSAAATSDPIEVYETVRSTWNQLVATPLGLTTYWDNAVVAADTPPPWVQCSFRLLEPFYADSATILTPGRVIAALNWPLSGGTDPTAETVEAIVSAFDALVVGRLTFQTPARSRVGRTPLQTWQTNIRLPFTFEVHDG